MDVFNVLYQFRLRMGLSQHQVSKKTGLTPNDICRFENDRIPSFGKCLIISKTLGIDIDALVRNDLAAVMNTFTKPAVAHHRLSRELDRKNAIINELGRRGEDYVYACELESLKGTPWVNAVNPNIADEVSAGFDILSFFPDGTPKFIEVILRFPSRYAREIFRQALNAKTIRLQFTDETITSAIASLALCLESVTKKYARFACFRRFRRSMRVQSMNL